MHSNYDNENEQELFDGSKNQTIKQDSKVVTSTQREDSRVSIKGRPNIDEISKRNEEEKKRDKRSSYKITGIITLMIIIIGLLVYFFR